MKNVQSAATQKKVGTLVSIIHSRLMQVLFTRLRVVKSVSLASNDAIKLNTSVCCPFASQVQLKRKHWTGGDANQGERLAKIQRAQLSHAEQRAAEQLKGPGKADKGDKVPAAKKRKAEPAAASGGVGLLHKA
eukprot:scaffold103503_cov18-Tisochrysis_lutea.AAC.2